MLRNRYAKDIGGICTGQKIIHNKPHGGGRFDPFLRHRRVKRAQRYKETFTC